MTEATTEHSGELRQTLCLGDLVLAQVLVIVGLSSIGPAARLGSFHWAYWLLGIALFQVPLAIVVMHLTRAMPLEGGPYQWARAAFGDFAGFMVAWNFWHFIIVFLSLLGLTVAAAIGYATGASETWMSNRAWQIGLSAAVTLLLMALAIAGLGAAKWLHDAASVALLLAIAVLIALPLFSRSPRVEVVAGSFSLMQLVLFTRIAVYALAGLECMAILIGECRGGARAVTKSIGIAVPLIGATYILGTHSVLSFVAPKDVDQINPVAQAFSIALRPFGSVAGIAVACATMFACSFAAILFAGRQEAFQILLNTAGVLFASFYLVMFAIPLRTPAPRYVIAIAVVVTVVNGVGVAVFRAFRHRRASSSRSTGPLVAIDETPRRD